MARKEIREILAANLKALMKTTPGMGSQPKVAARSKVGQTTVGRILRADVMAEYETIDSLARAFGRTPEQLLSPSFADELLAADLGRARQTVHAGKRSATPEVAQTPEEQRALDAWRDYVSMDEGIDKELAGVAWTRAFQHSGTQHAARNYRAPKGKSAGAPVHLGVVPAVPKSSKTKKTTEAEEDEEKK